MIKDGSLTHHLAFPSKSIAPSFSGRVILVALVSWHNSSASPPFSARRWMGSKMKMKTGKGACIFYFPLISNEGWKLRE